MKKKTIKKYKVKNKLEAQKIFSVYATIIEQAKRNGTLLEIDYDNVEIKKKIFKYHVILYREEFNLKEFMKELKKI